MQFSIVSVRFAEQVCVTAVTEGGLLVSSNRVKQSTYFAYVTILAVEWQL